MNGVVEQTGRDHPDERRNFGDESGIIVFGRGCSTRDCLFWIVVSVVLSVGLTILVNLILLSSGGISV